MTSDDVVNASAVIDRDELLRRADLPLYRAKRHQRGKFVTYDASREWEGLQSRRDFDRTGDATSRDCFDGEDQLLKR